MATIRSAFLALGFILISLILFSCGGGGGTEDTGTAEKSGVVLETSNPENPFIAIGANASVYGFMVNPDTGKATGLTMTAADGTESYMVIDEDTGLVDYWQYEDTITIFTNYRTNLGLVDVVVLDENGSTTATYTDISYLPDSANRPENVANFKIISKTGNKLAAKASTWFEMANAFGVAISTSACVSGSIIAATGTSIVLPIAIPIIATGGKALAVACVASATGILTLRSNAVTTGIDNLTRDTLVENLASSTNINEYAGTGAALHTAAECIGAIASAKATGFAKDCLPIAVDTIAFIGSKTAGRLWASIQSVKHLSQHQSASGIFCCDGPSQIKQGVQGDWTAIAISNSYPVGYLVNFDNPNGTWTIGQTTDGVINSSHTYPSVGKYSLVAAAKFDGVNATAAKAYNVEVYPELQLTCCTSNGTTVNNSSSFKTNTEVTIGMELVGGKKPYRYEVDLGNDTVEKITSPYEIKKIAVTYEKAGSYDVSFKVTDAENVVKESAIHHIDVANEDLGTNRTTCPITYDPALDDDIYTGRIRFYHNDKDNDGRYEDYLRCDYFGSGQLEIQVPYVDDKMQGERIRYYEYGLIWTTSNYVEGHRHGVYKEYYYIAGEIVKITCINYNMGAIESYCS